MKKNIAWFMVLSLLFICIKASSQILEEDLSVSEEVIRNKYEEAVRKFNSVDQSSSIYDFNEIIVILEAAQRDKTLSPSLTSFLLHSYDLRAQVYYNIGDLPKSESDILSILNYDMDYSPSKEASVKFLKNYEVIKSKMTGYYSVSTKPTGAKIYIDNKLRGYSNTPALKYRTGIFSLKIILDGYETIEKMIEINSGQTTKISFDLKRVTAALFIQTCPNGVEVYLNDKYYGVTSASAAAEDIVKLKNVGLDPEKCSAVLNIPNIPLAKYRMILKKPCYQDSVMTMDLPQPEDYILNPIAMLPSQGELILQETPKDAEVILNGQSQGRGAVSLKNLCSGPYTLIVKFQRGKYLKQFELHKDETVYVSPSQKPTLLFGGVLTTGEDVSFDNPIALKAIINLDNLQTINVYTPTINDRHEDKGLSNSLTAISDNLDRNTLETGIYLEPTTSKIKDVLLEKYNSDMLLIIKEITVQEYQMILFNKGNGTADSESFVFEDAEMDSENLKYIFERLDVIPIFQTPWLGFFPVEPLAGEGLLVIEVRKNSPAEKSGISVGDKLLFINTRRMTDSRRYNEVLGQLKQGEDASLKIERNGTIKDINVKIATSTIIPIYSNGIYYLNRALAEIVDGKANDSLIDSNFVIPFLKAVYHYYLDSNEESLKDLDSLKDAKSETIDPGLVELFKSLIYTKMGDNRKALEEREKALKYPDSRLYDKNGMPIRIFDKYILFP